MQLNSLQNTNEHAHQTNSTPNNWPNKSPGHQSIRPPTKDLRHSDLRHSYPRQPDPRHHDQSLMTFSLTPVKITGVCNHIGEKKIPRSKAIWTDSMLSQSGETDQQKMKAIQQTRNESRKEKPPRGPEHSSSSRTKKSY